MTVRPHLAIVVTDIYAMNVLGRGQLEHFNEAGVDLTLVCGGDRDKFEPLKARGVGEVVRVPLQRKPHFVHDLLAFIALLKIFLTRRFDAVVCSTPKAMLLGSIAAAVTMQPNRTVFVRGRAYENFRGAKRAVYEWFDRLSFLCSHRVIFLSPSLREAYADDGLSAGTKGTIIGAGSSNGVDTGRFRPVGGDARASLRRSLGFRDEAFNIVFAGRIAPDKGIATGLQLIDRLADRKDIAWHFVGGVEDDALHAALTARRHLRVRHVDHTDRLEQWLAAADLHFMPSEREGFGNVAVEAAATGTPTFAFDVVGLRDSVSGGTSGQLFPFGDVAALEQAIRKAADDPAGFRNRFARAREWAALTFPQEATWDAYLANYLAAGRA